MNYIRSMGFLTSHDLLIDLNDSRKAVAYGDVEAPDFEDRDVAIEIERYVEAVGRASGHGRLTPLYGLMDYSA